MTGAGSRRPGDRWKFRLHACHQRLGFADQPRRAESFQVSNDPLFVAKVRAIALATLCYASTTRCLTVAAV